MENHKLKGEIQAENRRYPRMKIKLDVHYDFVQAGEIPNQPRESRAEDMGAGGLAMRLDRSLEIGQLITVNLYLPPLNYVHNIEKPRHHSSAKDYFPVTLLCRVVWCQKQKGKNYYMAGLKFFDCDLKNRDYLKEFLLNYDLDKPMGALF